MDLASSRIGSIISLSAFLVVPAAITALQFLRSSQQSVVIMDSTTFIILSTIFYAFMVLVPSWSALYTTRIGSHWFMMIILLYLLSGTLLFVVESVLWSYIVLILTLVFSVFMMRPVYTYSHYALLSLYIVASLWLLSLFVIQTRSIFMG